MMCRLCCAGTPHDWDDERLAGLRGGGEDVIVSNVAKAMLKPHGTLSCSSCVILCFAALASLMPLSSDAAT
jgi:hypothetical protein